MLSIRPGATIVPPVEWEVDKQTTLAQGALKFRDGGRP